MLRDRAKTVDTTHRSTPTVLVYGKEGPSGKVEEVSYCLFVWFASALRRNLRRVGFSSGVSIIILWDLSVELPD